jgi:integrase/recombinase XerD
MEHIRQYLVWKRTMNESAGEDGFLLLSSHGKAFSIRTLQYAFKVSIKEAGLPSYYSIHACRHSYGTYLYKKTKDLRLVQKQLGHSSITTTTVYADVTVEETLDAVNGLYKGGDNDEE